MFWFKAEGNLKGIQALWVWLPMQCYRQEIFEIKLEQALVNITV